MSTGRNPMIGAFDTQDRSGATALHYAAANGDVEMFNAELAKLDTNVLQQDNAGRTVLHYAVLTDRPEIIRCIPLTVHQALRAAPNPQSHPSPLSIAVRNNQLESIRALVTWGGANIHEKNASNYSLLLQAIHAKPFHSKTINQLLELGADLADIFPVHENILRNHLDILAHNIVMNLDTSLESSENHTHLLNTIYDYFASHHPSEYRAHFARPRSGISAALYTTQEQWRPWLLDRGYNFVNYDIYTSSLARILLKRGLILIDDVDRIERLKQSVKSPLIDKLIELVQFTENTTEELSARAKILSSEAADIDKKEIEGKLKAAKAMVAILLLGLDVQTSHAAYLQSNFFSLTFSTPVVSLYQWFLKSDLVSSDEKRKLQALVNPVVPDIITAPPVANDCNAINCDGDSELHLAVTNEDIAKARTLLSQPHIKPNARNLRGDTPLHVAVIKGNLDMVRLLIECPLVIIDTYDRYKNSPLQLALRNQLIDIALLLWQHTRLFSHSNVHGDTILHDAMRWGSVAVVHELLKNDEITNLRRSHNLKGFKPLFYAANADVARLIHPKHVDFNFCEATIKPSQKKKSEYRKLIADEKDGRTRSALELLLYLKIIEKEIRLTGPFTEVFSSTDWVNNPVKVLKEAKRHAAYLILHILSNITLPPSIRLLDSIDNIIQGRLGEIVNRRSSNDVDDAIISHAAVKELLYPSIYFRESIHQLFDFIDYTAVNSKWLPIANQMLATLNTRPLQRFNVSLLDVASRNTLRDIYLNVVRQSPALAGCGNETEMHVAATGANYGLWRILCHHGKNPLPADEHGYTPLHYAAAANEGSAINDIWQHNPQQFASEMRRGLQSPLRLATKHDSLLSIEILVAAYRANINERDANGVTLLRMSTESQPIQPRTITTLIQHGADMSTLFLTPEDNSFSINHFLSLVTQLIHSVNNNSSLLNSLFDYFFANYPTEYRKFFSRHLLRPNDETNAANISCVLDRGHSSTLLAKTATYPTLSLTLLKRGAFLIYDLITREDIQKRFNSPLLNKLIELMLHLNEIRKTYHRTRANALLTEINAAEDLLEMILFERTETRDDYSDLLQSSFFTFDKPLVALYKWFLASDLTPHTVKQVLPSLAQRKCVFERLAMQSYRYSKLQRLACDDQPQAAAEVSKLLADPKIQPNAKNIDGVTALHLAAEKCLFHMISLFVHCPRVIVDIENALGETPLFLALRSSHANRMDVALLLLQHTEMFNHTDHYANSLLHIAAQISIDPTISELLLTFIKELLKNEHARQFLSKPNKKGFKPLFYVENNTELATLLTPDNDITLNRTSPVTDIYNADFILPNEQHIHESSLTSLIRRETHTRTRLAMITLIYINEKDCEIYENKAVKYSPFQSYTDNLALDKRYAAYLILCILSNEPIPTPSVLVHTNDKICQGRLGVLFNEIMSSTTDLPPHYKDQVKCLLGAHAAQPATLGQSIFSRREVAVIPNAEQRQDAPYQAGGIFAL